MSFRTMNFKWFESKVKNLDFSKPDMNRSYQFSYPSLISYFQELDFLEQKHLVIGAHAVYGWMPTILNMKKHDNKSSAGEELKDELELLNKAKKGESIDEIDLNILKRRINNSTVGLSKLLHFVNPRKYAIWDNRIYKFVTDKKTAYGINEPKKYLEYMEGFKRIAYDGKFSEFRNENSFSFENKGVYSEIEITDFRFIELSLFRVA